MPQVPFRFFFSGEVQVDFINANLGVGFTVPIIMLKHVLGIRDIGYIAATSGELKALVFSEEIVLGVES